MATPIVMFFLDEAAWLNVVSLGAALVRAGAVVASLASVADAPRESELVLELNEIDVVEEEKEKVVEVDDEILIAEPALFAKLPNPPNVDVLKSETPQHPPAGACPS